MKTILDILSWACLLGGGMVIIIGAIGLIRFPDFFTRIHAASVIDTLGCMLIFAGLILQAGPGLVTIKLLLIILFILFTSPASTHALAKSALHGKLEPILGSRGEHTSKS